jgi:hypothetical protein
MVASGSGNVSEHIADGVVQKHYALALVEVNALGFDLSHTYIFYIVTKLLSHQVTYRITFQTKSQAGREFGAV